MPQLLFESWKTSIPGCHHERKFYHSPQKNTLTHTLPHSSTNPCFYPYFPDEEMWGLKKLNTLPKVMQRAKGRFNTRSDSKALLLNSPLNTHVKLLFVSKCSVTTKKLCLKTILKMLLGISRSDCRLTRRSPAFLRYKSMNFSRMRGEGQGDQ